MHVSCRASLESDLAQIWQVAEPHCGPQFAWSLEKLQAELRSNFGMVAESQGQLVAFVLYRKMQEIAEITVLASRADHLRRGQMRQLLQNLIAELCDAQGHGRLWLEVHERNQPAIKLYESLNFKRVGRRPAYYRDGSAALLFERILQAPT